MTSEMPPKMPLKVGGPPARNFIFQWADRDHRQYAILLPMEKSTHRITVIVACALAGAAALLCAAWWLAGSVKAARQAAERQELYKRLGIDADPKREFIPLPDILPHNAPAARLGQSLFVDRRLARSPYRMCGACHRLNEGGIDARALDGTLPRTAYNAVFADVFLHDGSVTGMPALVRHMIGSTNFCAGGSISNVAERLAADEKTRKMFQLAYTNGVTADNVVNALVEYQRTLFTSRRKFDHWCAGRTNALDAVQQRGVEEPLLGAEIGVEPLLVDSGGGGDVIDRGAVQPFRGENGDRRRQNFVAGLDRSLLHRLPSFETVVPLRCVKIGFVSIT